MSFKYKSFFILTFSLWVSGCISSHYVENVDDVIANSPHIKFLSEDRYQPSAPSQEIELYYKYWSPFTRPDAVKNWKYLFVMGEASSPKWSYTKLSQVVIAQRQRDDRKAITEMRDIAYRQGGDGLIDLHREPMIDAPRSGAKITGFRYRGVVVRKK